MSRLMVPNALWNKAESLSVIGVEEMAWPPEDATQLLELLRPTEIAVLGGDVYAKRAGRFEPSYESWFTEQDPQEVPSVFATRSRSVARDYLAKLMKPGADQWWVTLVLSESMERAEEEDLGVA